MTMFPSGDDVCLNEGLESGEREADDDPAEEEEEGDPVVVDDDTVFGMRCESSSESPIPSLVDLCLVWT